MDHFDANLSFSKEDMQLLNELGQNVIRLGIITKTNIYQGDNNNVHTYNFFKMRISPN